MRYSAFISYNHRDARWAAWLHRALEQYRVPKHLWGRAAPWGEIGARLPPVFRDREELASSADLAASVQAALAEAATLIVVCSPNSAQSRWVDQEVRAFIDGGRRGRVLCVIVDGEPHSADPATECLPPALLAGDGPEPLAADARQHGDGRDLAKLKLLAGILTVPFDDLRRREAQRRQRRLAMIATASLAGMVVTSGLAAFALVSRADAVRQRDIARERNLTLEHTLSFVKSMFKVADPSEARGENITVREAVDRGASSLDTGLQGEPTVKVELGVTLAEVYAALGLYRRGDALLERTLKIHQPEPLTSARQFSAMGESQFNLGEYDKSLSWFRRAAKVAPSAEPALLSRILVGQGQSLSAVGDEAAADRAIQRALRIDRARRGAEADVARDLEALGLNKFFGGDFARAKPLIEEALRIRLATEGPLSPSVVTDRNALASIAHQFGRLAEAEKIYRENLAVDEKVLGKEHPDLAATLNNLARVVLEQRRFREAAALLERAVAITVEARGAEHDDMAFMFSNLALAKRNLGDTARARSLFQQAVATARRTEHPFLGPILTDQADLECAAGKTGTAISLLDEAAPLIAEQFPGDAWRAAWAENVRGNCLLRAGNRAGVALVRRSGPVVLKRWPQTTLFGFEAAKRGRQVGA